MRERQEISDLLLEQYLLGELSPRLQRKVREELSRDPSLRARHEAITRSNREILERYPPSLIAKEISRRAAPAVQRRASRWNPPLAIGLPAAAAVLIAFSFFMFRDLVAPDNTRIKGISPHMSAWIGTAQGARDLAPGSLVGRGDVIQLSYTAGEAKYGVIFSIDGRGTVTWHMPAGFSGTPRAAPMLDRQGQVFLPSAYELDDAPGFERFFFIFAEKPFDIAPVAEAVRSLAARPGSADRLDLSLPSGIRQYSLLLKKRDHTS